jgi:hypothetical protein
MTAKCVCNHGNPCGKTIVIESLSKATLVTIATASERRSTLLDKSGVEQLIEDLGGTVKR